MDTHVLALTACCLLAAVFLLSQRINADKQKKNSFGRNDEFFSKENFEVADREKQEENHKESFLSDVNAVVYLSREDVAHVLEILDDIRKNVDDKDAEDITFDINTNNRRISIVIGNRKEIEK